MNTSPPIGTPTIPSKEGENAGFYLLKKDSERRVTLVQVLNEDGHIMCDYWLHLLQQSVQGLLLTSDHLHILLGGIRDYIPEQNKIPLTQAIGSVKEDLEFDGANQIQLAFLVAQDAINRVLRNRNIKPHWMFALDSLIRNAVQAAITILSPELGENLAGEPWKTIESKIRGEATQEPLTFGSEGSTIKCSNSLPKEHNMDSGNGSMESANCLKRKYEKIREENLVLWEQLVAAESQLNFLLKDQLNERQRQIKVLSTTGALLNGSQTTSSSCDSQDIKVDPDLVKWLENRNIEQEAMEKVRSRGGN